MAKKKRKRKHKLPGFPGGVPDAGHEAQFGGINIKEKTDEILRAQGDHPVGIVMPKVSQKRWDSIFGKKEK